MFLFPKGLSFSLLLLFFASTGWAAIDKLIFVEDPYALEIPPNSPFHQALSRHYEKLWPAAIKSYIEWLEDEDSYPLEWRQKVKNSILDRKNQLPALHLISSHAEIGYIAIDRNQDGSIKNRSIYLSTQFLELLDYQLDAIVAVLAHELIHALQPDTILRNSRLAEEQADSLAVRTLEKAGYNPKGFEFFFKVVSQFEKDEDSTTQLLDIADVHRLSHIRQRQVEKAGPWPSLDRTKNLDLSLSRLSSDQEMQNNWDALMNDVDALSYDAILVRILDLYVPEEDHDPSEVDKMRQGAYHPVYSLMDQLARTRIRDEDSIIDFVDFTAAVRKLFANELGHDLFASMYEYDKYYLENIRSLEFLEREYTSLDVMQSNLKLFYTFFIQSTRPDKSLDITTYEGGTAWMLAMNPFKENHNFRRLFFSSASGEGSSLAKKGYPNILIMNFANWHLQEQTVQKLMDMKDGLDDMQKRSRLLGNCIRIAYLLADIEPEFEIEGLYWKTYHERLQERMLKNQLFHPRLYEFLRDRTSEAEDTRHYWLILGYLIDPHALEELSPDLRDVENYFFILNAPPLERLEERFLDFIGNFKTDHFKAPSNTMSDSRSYTIATSEILFLGQKDPDRFIEKIRNHLPLELKEFVFSKPIDGQPNFYLLAEKYFKNLVYSNAFLQSSLENPQLETKRAEHPYWYNQEYNPNIDRTPFPVSFEIRQSLQKILGLSPIADSPNIFKIKDEEHYLRSSDGPRFRIDPDEVLRVKPWHKEKGQSKFESLLDIMRNEVEEHSGLTQEELEEFSLDPEEEDLVEFFGDEKKLTELLIDALDYYGGLDLPGSSFYKLESYEIAAEFVYSIVFLLENNHQAITSLDQITDPGDRYLVSNILKNTLPQYNLLSDRLAIDGLYSLLFNHPYLGDEITLREASTLLQEAAFQAFNRIQPWAERSFSEKMEVLGQLTQRANSSFYLDTIQQQTFFAATPLEMRRWIFTQRDLAEYFSTHILSPVVRNEIAAFVGQFLDKDEHRAKFFTKMSQGQQKLYLHLWEIYLDLPVEGDSHDVRPITENLYNFIHETSQILEGGHNGSSDESAFNLARQGDFYSKLYHVLDAAIAELSIEEALKLAWHISDPERFPLSPEERQKLNEAISHQTQYPDLNIVRLLTAMYDHVDPDRKRDMLAYVLWSHPDALYTHTQLLKIGALNPLFSQEKTDEMDAFKKIFWETLSFHEKALILSQSLVMKAQGRFFDNDHFILMCLDMMEVVGRKLAQLLTTHGTFVPEELRKAFQTFRDQNRHTHRLQQIAYFEKSMQATHGKSVWSYVDSFGRVIKAGSMKTPIEANLKDRKKTVMKQIDPIVKNRVQRNLEVLTTGVESWGQEQSTIQQGTITYLLRRLSNMIGEEISIGRENENTIRHTTNQRARQAPIQSLELIEYLSTPDMSTVHYIEHQGNLNEIEPTPEVAERVVDELIQQFGRDRFVHGDLQNPANILLDLAGNPVFLDLSLSQEVAVEDVALIQKILWRLSNLQNEISSRLNLAQKIQAGLQRQNGKTTVQLLQQFAPDLYHELVTVLEFITEELDENHGAEQDIHENSAWLDQVAQNLMESDSINLADVLLNLETANRKFADRYLFLIELFAILYGYEQQSLQSQDPFEVITSLKNKLGTALDENTKGQILNRPTDQLINDCRKLF